MWCLMMNDGRKEKKKERKAVAKGEGEGEKKEKKAKQRKGVYVFTKKSVMTDLTISK